MKLDLPYIDRLWRVRSSVSIEEQLSPREGFDRMAPLFQTQTTEAVLDGDTLIYTKTNPAAQDKLATFTSGTLRLTESEGQTTLDYDVKSTALLLCFLAPLLFLALGGVAIALNTIDPVIEERGAEDEKDQEARELHWFDQMMGVPAPEVKDEEEDGEEEDKDEKHNPIPAYVLAGLFAVIYLVGRFLEPYLLRRTFRTALKGGYVATPEGAVLREKLAAYGLPEEPTPPINPSSAQETKPTT